MLRLRKGDRLLLVERLDGVDAGWCVGKRPETGEQGIFPEGEWIECFVVVCV